MVAVIQNVSKMLKHSQTQSRLRHPRGDDARDYHLQMSEFPLLIVQYVRFELDLI